MHRPRYLQGGPINSTAVCNDLSLTTVPNTQSISYIQSDSPSMLIAHFHFSFNNELIPIFEIFKFYIQRMFFRILVFFFCTECHVAIQTSFF